LPKAKIKEESKGESFAKNDDNEADRKVVITAYKNKKALNRPKLSLTELETENLVVKEKSIHYNNPRYLNTKAKTSDGIQVDFNDKKTNISNIKSGIKAENMIKNRLNAFDENGNALITDGMFSMDVVTDGKDTVKVSIPSKNADPEMKLYLGKINENGELVWVMTSQKYTIDKNGNYVFDAYLDGSGEYFYNMDKKAGKTYVFNLKGLDIINANISTDFVRFAGKTQKGELFFSSSSRIKLRPYRLLVSHKKSDTQNQNLSLAVRYFNKSKTKTTVYYNLKPKYEKRYILASN